MVYMGEIARIDLRNTDSLCRERLLPRFAPFVYGVKRAAIFLYRDNRERFCANYIHACIIMPEFGGPKPLLVVFCATTNGHFTFRGGIGAICSIYMRNDCPRKLIACLQYADRRESRKITNIDTQIRCFCYMTIRQFSCLTCQLFLTIIVINASMHFYVYTVRLEESRKAYSHEYCVTPKYMSILTFTKILFSQKQI